MRLTESKVVAVGNECPGRLIYPCWQTRTGRQLRMALEFLGIGAPRSGTTWLYHELRRHPQIFMPPVKELRHFRNSRTLSERTRTVQKLLADDSLTPRDRQFLSRWQSYDPLDDRQYLEMFEFDSQVTCGEFSPVYSAADRSLVARIRKTVGPETKIILLARDPIDRDWSHANYWFHVFRNQDRDSLCATDYREFVSRKWVRQRSDYATIINRWRKAFGGNVFVGFFDEIRNDPARLLSRLSEFLGIESDPVWLRNLTRKAVNSSLPGSTHDHLIPDEMLRHLAQVNRSPLKKLVRLLPEEFPRRWLERAESILSRT